MGVRYDHDYILDMGGDGSFSVQPDDSTTMILHTTSFRGRPWLAVHWLCCGAYSRIYRNRQATAYQGNCPRCGKAVRVTISPEGTNARFFEAW